MQQAKHQMCTHCGAPINGDVYQDPLGLTFHPSCIEDAHNERIQHMQQEQQDDDGLEVEQAVELDPEPDDIDGTAYRRDYDEAKQEVKDLEKRLHERILEDPELRGLYKKIEQAEDKEDEAKDAWYENVYTPAKNEVKRAKRRREEAFEQAVNEAIVALKQEGRDDVVERLEGAKTRLGVDGATITKAGLKFEASTWDGMRLDLQTDVTVEEN